MPIRKGAPRFTDVLHDGEIVYHTYRGRTWQARYQDLTFIDTEDPTQMYGSPSEFANSHLSVATGVNGLKVCKVERDGKRVALSTLLAAPEPDPGPSPVCADESKPPKPRILLADMKAAAKRKAADAAGGGAGSAEAPAASPAAATAKKKQGSVGASTTAARSTAQRPIKAQAASPDLYIPPPVSKILTPRVVESKSEPYDIHEITCITITQITHDGVNYYADMSSKTVYQCKNGCIGAPVGKLVDGAVVVSED